jgi:hypothetical protein
MDKEINSPENIDKLLAFINKRKRELHEETQRLIKANQKIMNPKKD